jgi:phage tail-like protein
MPKYPLPKFHFQVQWGGTRIGFTEITGLDMQVESPGYREDSSLVSRKLKLRGMQKFTNITLKRGTIHSDSDFYKWINRTNLNIAERSDILITMLNEAREPVITWKAVNAFPVKIQASDLKADGNEVAIETLEIAHEGLNIVN